MPPRDHLPLWRLIREEPRRKRPGFGAVPERPFGAHGARIAGELAAVTAAVRARPALPGVDPKLILKVELSNPIDEDQWRGAGLHVLAQNPGNILVLFADSFELEAFRARVAAFQQGPEVGRTNPPYYGFVGNIERVSEVDASDRIGPRLKAQGIVDLGNIDGRQAWVVDVEIWDAGAPGDRQLRAFGVGRFVEGLGGQRIGQPFVGSSGSSVLRVRLRGAALRTLLDRPEVAGVDLPPLPDLGERDPPALTIHELPPVVPPAGDAPLIGVIDSGLNAHPLIDGVVIERIGVPPGLGTADDWGHGTKVAGIAAYGDVRDRIARRDFGAPVRLMSVRVVNDRGTFDDETTIPAQMRAAVTALVGRGCRVINLSLGDRNRIPYADGRASLWAGELDALAREFDVVIVVSAGNAGSMTGPPPWGPRNEGILASYPAYLTSRENRLIDPAIAANVVTVGALAHGNGLRDDPHDGVQVRAITNVDEPSPVTRSGPGVGGAVKPEFCDYGGTLVFDGHVDRLRRGADWASAGVLTLNDDYLRSLFTAATGTSYAAPRVAYKAALIAGRFPRASANLIRALLAVSADLPLAAIRRLQPAYEPGVGFIPAVRQCLGYGMPQVGRALASEEARVVLLADRQELELDQVALYVVPLPAEFRQTRGRRSIRVALAFDPPTRHTRLEYLGTRMSFYLLRGLTPEQIFEHFRRRDDGTRHPAIPDNAKCGMEPGIDARETSTLQCATWTQAVNRDVYGDTFYVAVFSHRRWAGDEVIRQRFALAVELTHDGCQTLHQRCSALNAELRVRLNVQP
jgi:subtilisin family serine protease